MSKDKPGTGTDLKSQGKKLLANALENQVDLP